MKKNKYKYNAGGKVGFQDVAGLASAFVNPISAIPSALNLIGKLAYNPASYTPAKMNESPMGYNDGGDPEKPKKSTKIKLLDGSPGIDKQKINIGPEGDYTNSVYSPNLLRRQLISSKEDFGQDDMIIDKIRKTKEGYKRANDKEIVNDVINYYGELYNSEFYKRNQPKEVIDKRKLNYKYEKNIKTKYDSDKNRVYSPSAYSPNIHLYSRSEADFINSLYENLDAGVANMDAITAHEINHALYEPSSSKLTKSKMKIDSSTSNHDKNPEEIESDINAIRYDMYRYNIWDMKRDINKEDVKKLRSLKYKGFSTNRVKDVIPSDDDLIKLLNKVAYQDNNLGNTIKASYGADLQNQLQISGGNDQQMGDHAVQVEGNPGIDTNYRNIGGQDVALTQGEIVRQDQDGSAYVWSNNPKMKHPSGTTFAKAMKPIENKIARLKSRVEKDHTDVYAKNALGHLEQMIEQNKNIEETMRQKKGSPTAQRFNMGGTVKKYNPGGYIDPIIPNGAMDIYVNAALNQQGVSRSGKSQLSPLPRNPLKNISESVSPTIQTGAERFESLSTSPFTNSVGFINANPSPLTSVTGTGLPKTESLSTFEDKAFLGAKSLETAFRVGAALDKPIQYDTRRYNVDRIRYSPQRALDANQANYQGAHFDINTGNANTDRILRNNLYGQKMAADRDVIGKNDQMQNQSDLQVNQYNAQAKANVDNINEQIRGRDYQATDAALTSIGNLSSIFQQAGGAKAHNRITMSTLNSLSRRYGIDVPELMALMQGEGDLNKGTVKYKGNGNG